MKCLVSDLNKVQSALNENFIDIKEGKDSMQ